MWLTDRGLHESPDPTGPHTLPESDQTDGMKRPHLSVYAALLIVALAAIQLAASLLFYRAIDEQTLLDDHARRVAELLVVSDRVFRLDGNRTPSLMSSKHLQVTVAATASVKQAQDTYQIEEIGRLIVAWEPSLASKALRLSIEPAGRGRRDLIGSMPLEGGRWLNFRSRDISSMWPIALRATWMTLVTTFACLVAGLAAVRLLMRPLRRLSDAAAEIGKGRRVAIDEAGPTDVRDLARSMNTMQDRIAGLLEEQAKSFEAISHDLGTPLARQKLAAELVPDDDVREIMEDSVREMEAMLHSLRQFLRAQHLTAEPAPVDLHCLLREVSAPHADKVRIAPGNEVVVETFREPLWLALQALIDNACRFGSQVHLAVLKNGSDWIIEIADDGPGVAPEHFEDIIAPFVRLDLARGRTTKGFGLGVPTAYRLITRFGGKLSFHQGRGLIVHIEVPRPGQ